MMPEKLKRVSFRSGYWGKLKFKCKKKKASPNEGKTKGKGKGKGTLKSTRGETNYNGRGGKGGETSYALGLGTRVNDMI